MARRILFLMLLGVVSSSLLPARAVHEDDIPLLNNEARDGTTEARSRGSLSLSSLDSSLTDPEEAVPPVPQYDTFLVEEPGRVSVQVTSPTGAIVRLVDRSRGVIASDGRLGEEDGRIDIVLDAGEYRILTERARESEEVSTLVQFFEERNAEGDTERLMTLQPGEIHQVDLQDLQQRSFWVAVESDDDYLDFEAMGRSLAGVAIWWDGVLMIEDQPAVTNYSPETGRPVGWVDFHRQVEPGNYLVTFYGGESRTWENEGPADTFYVRRGGEELGTFVDQQLEISPFGRDFYRVPGETTFFELENSDMIPATIGLIRSLAGRGSSSFLDFATVERDAVSSRASFQNRTSTDDRYMVVGGTPGDTVRVRSMPVRRTYRFPPAPSGSRYLVSSYSSLDAEAVADATPLLSAWNSSRDEYEVIDAFPLSIARGSPLFREINLFEEQSIYVEFDRDGNWGILSDEEGDADVAYALIPVRDVTDTIRPLYQDGPEAIVDVDAGLYELRIAPRRPGIHRFVVYFSGVDVGGFRRSRAQALLREGGQLPRRDATFVTEPVFTGTSRSLLLTGNNRGSVRTSLFVDALPLTLERSVPLTLDPGEEIELPLDIAFAGTLEYESEQIDIEINGAEIVSGHLLQRGRSTLVARNSASSAGSILIRLVRQPELLTFRAPETPRLTDLFPTLVSGESTFVDMERNRSLFYLLDVTDPGLYELQTTGRLETRIRVRTAVDAQGSQASANGPGRNALLQDYFRAGQYLVQVSTRGQSAGRMGLEMRNLDLVDGGIVRPGPVYRHEIPANQGLLQHVRITASGRHRLNRYSLHGDVSYRIEDADGWPVNADWLIAGSYRHIVRPRDVWSRTLLQVLAVEDSESAEDEFHLSIPATRERTWRESPERTPQVFPLTIPAPLDIRLELPQQMEWSLQDSSGAEVERGTGGGDLTLSAGAYRLLVRPVEENDNVAYRVRVTTEMVAPGISQTRTRMPSFMEVSIPEDGVYELWTLGERDISALLVGEDGEPAFSDDRPADWNVLISRFFEAGIYQLGLIDSFSSQRGAVTVHLFQRSEVVVEEQQGDVDAQITIGADVVVVPFRTASTNRIYRVAVDRPEVLLSLYRGATLLADTRDELAIALEPETDYTIRLVNSSTDPTNVALRLTGSEPERIEWDGVVPFSARSGPVRLINRSGIAVFVDGLGAVAPGVELPLRSVDGAFLAGSDGELWLLPGADGRTPVLEPMGLEPAEEAIVYVTDHDFEVTLSPSPDDVTIVTVESVDGFLGLSTGSADGAPAEWSQASLRSGVSTMLLANRRAAALRLWDAEPLPMRLTSEVSEPTAPYGGRRVTLRREVLSTTIVEERQQESFTIPPRSALIVSPDVSGSVELLLEPGLMAGAETIDGPLWTVVATPRQPSFRRALDGGRLLLANPEDTPRIARIVPAPGVSEARLSSDRSFSVVLGRAADLHVEIPALPDGAELRIYAPDAASPFLLSSDGLRIDPAPPGGAAHWTLPGRSGTLALSAEAGPVVVWVEEPGEDDVPWLTMEAARAQELTSLQLLEPSPQQWRFRLDEPALISISTFSSGGMALYREERLESFSIGEQRSMVRFAQPGAYRLFTRSLAGEDQDAPLEFAILEPVSITESEPPPRVLLDTGQRAAFSFEVAQEAPIGVGFSGSHEEVRVTLLSEAGSELSSGRLLYREVPPGRYFLVAENRGSAGSFEPIVVANEGSRRGVPLDVVREFREASE